MEKQKYLKPESIRKSHRNHLIRQYWANHHTLTLAEIGKVFGITKQRVSIIIKSGGSIDED